MEEKYIIAVDMDGTLLNSRGQITERTEKTLQMLLDQGHLVVPASGRPFPLLPPKVAALKGISYAVLENGAVVWDWKASETMEKKALPKGSAVRILADVADAMSRQAQPSPYYIEFFVDGKAYTEVMDFELLEQAKGYESFVAYMKENHVYLENLPAETELLEQAEKLNIYFADLKFSAAFREKWAQDPELYVTTSVAGNVEFNAAGVNKGVGLAALMRITGIPADRVIAIGDNENDLEMFEVAEHGVAMGNAADHVKAAAKYQTADCDHDGAAEFLEKFFKFS